MLESCEEVSLVMLNLLRKGLVQIFDHSDEGFVVLKVLALVLGLVFVWLLLGFSDEGGGSLLKRLLLLNFLLRIHIMFNYSVP